MLLFVVGVWLCVVACWCWSLLLFVVCCCCSSRWLAVCCYVCSFTVVVSRFVLNVCRPCRLLLVVAILCYVVSLFSVN